MLEVYARLTGYRVQEDGWTEAIHEEDRARVLDEWRRAQEIGAFCAEYRLRFASDGCFHRVRGKSVRTITPGGREVWLGYIRDIGGDSTHRCQAERCYCPLGGLARS